MNRENTEQHLTLEEVKKLSEDELRIRVAELCGFDVWEGLHDRVIRKWMTKEGRHTPLLNYPGDLNAMNEAEKVLNWNQGCEYANWLNCQNRTEDDSDGEWLWHATARQRAEAFVLTLTSAASQPTHEKHDE